MYVGGVVLRVLVDLALIIDKDEGQLWCGLALGTSIRENQCDVGTLLDNVESSFDEHQCLGRGFERTGAKTARASDRSGAVIWQKSETWAERGVKAATKKSVGYLAASLAMLKWERMSEALLPSSPVPGSSASMWTELKMPLNWPAPWEGLRDQS